MKFTSITNGITQLVIVPETPLEKMFLQQFKDKKVSVVHYDKPISVLESPVPDSVVFRAEKEIVDKKETRNAKCLLVRVIDHEKVKKNHTFCIPYTTNIATLADIISDVFETTLVGRTFNGEVLTLSTHDEGTVLKCAVSEIEYVSYER